MKKTDAHCGDASAEAVVDRLVLGRGPPRVDGVEESPAGAYATELPVAGGELVMTDDRLAALVDWLRSVWAGATEEERAWLVVELRMLRGRLRAGGE